MRILGLTGNEAVAYAVKQCDVDVVAAYPITPQTIIVERISEYIANGEMDAEYICVESEHSALSACIGASVMGARVFTSTASQGLALMHEMLYIASGLRLPMVMAVVNRALSAPINIHGDHSDMMGSRDCGWIQIYAENAQEAYDTVIQAFKISEDPSVYLPVMIGLEGFILGQTTMPVEIPDEEQVENWLGERRQPYVIDGSTILGVGGLTFPEDTEDMFYNIQVAMENAKKIIREVDEEYGKLFDRKYGGLVSCYECEDSKYIAISMGAWSGDLIEAVYKLREEGYPVGVLRIRYYRPFPIEDIWEVIRGVKGVVVFDRAISFGAWGPIYSDLLAGLSLYTSKPPRSLNIVAGIAGVNVTSDDFYNIVKTFIEKNEKNELETGIFEWRKIRR